ncbi:MULTISPECIES: DUF3889 domain-containing protein [Bacillaceae]|uniref:DUF3889 domain-containing protein n=1 Tax=Evansella alkalicola TaxID=745819 RepID=A0ABS6JS71_9BACI|nr:MULTISPECIES: DUF3889 domain-containing protein [Bacillaceae]MBU9720916.1 DUF3889 domain-containing protein [Bacillus alkalicola]
MYYPYHQPNSQIRGPQQAQPGQHLYQDSGYSYYWGSHPSHYYERGPMPPTAPWPSIDERQQPLRGQATWTEGGDVTRCGIPWSHNQYMTAAVGTNTPYRCGQTLRIRNLTSSDQREIDVIVVDQVAEYPQTKVNLHRRAFEALGADPREGIIDVQIIPGSDSGQGIPIGVGQTPSPGEAGLPGQLTNGMGQVNVWGQYFIGVVQSAFPGMQVANFRSVERVEKSPELIEETFEIQLQSQQEQITVRGTINYNPVSNKVKSVEFNEI